MSPMNDGDMARRLAEATEALREHETTRSRHRQLQEALARAETRVIELAEAHTVEAGDVARLETLTLTRVLATLRGTRDDALARERAEADAAAYRLARARAEVDALQREADELAGRLVTLADAPRRYAEVLDDKERFLLAAVGDPRSARLLELAQARGRLDAEAKEIREAQQAAVAAAEAAAELVRLLDSAGGWSTYDTFFGGGAFSSAIKHDRLEQAANAATAVDLRLAKLNRELADVPGGTVVGLPQITELTQFVDIWFDNIFTDLAVRDQIKQAQARAGQCAGQIAQVRSRLGKRLAVVQAALAENATAREQTLTGSV